MQMQDCRVTVTTLGQCPQAGNSFKCVSHPFFFGRGPVLRTMAE